MGAMTLIKSNGRPSLIVEPREASELRAPITDYRDLLATMRGYRTVLNLPQLAVDHRAGLEDGYTGKLEIDTRRAIHESWWLWMGALGLVMILVRAKDAIRADKCPCCGSAIGGK